MLSEAGLRPRKRFGQHFLIDGNLMRRLVECAELAPADMVLEVGAGTGGLTDLIAGRVERVVAVEIDRDLFAVLTERFRDAAGVTLLCGDILAAKHRLMPAVEEMIRTRRLAPSGCIKLVANLPYQVATPLVMNLLVDYPGVRRLCFTVQAEVGDRITASPGCKAYGPLSITSQVLCKIETIARIGPKAFWPQPAVDSVMLRMDVVESPFAAREQLHDFVRVVRGAFEHRRKTLRSALAYALDEGKLEQAARACHLGRRPEEVPADEWLAIHRAV